MKVAKFKIEESESCKKKLISEIYIYIYEKPLKLIDQFTYLNSNMSSTESNVNICYGKT